MWTVSVILSNPLDYLKTELDGGSFIVKCLLNLNLFRSFKLFPVLLLVVNKIINLLFKLLFFAY